MLNIQNINFVSVTSKMQNITTSYTPKRKSINVESGKISNNGKMYTTFLHYIILTIPKTTKSLADENFFLTPRLFVLFCFCRVKSIGFNDGYVVCVDYFLVFLMHSKRSL